VAAAVGVPLLEAALNRNGTAYADGVALPIRFGTFFWGNGVKLDRWTPAATGAGWKPTEELAPLAALQNDITVVSGLNVPVDPSDGHGSGSAGMLTGGSYRLTNNGRKDINPTRESIDQLAATRIGMSSAFKSLELAITRRPVRDQGLLYGYTSFTSATSPNKGELDPLAVYNRIFSGFTGVASGPVSSPLAEATIRLRRSVLDLVRQDLKALSATVGTGDKRRLDQHGENIRAIEARLAAPNKVSTTTAGCKVAAVPGAAPTAPSEIVARTKLMAPLLAQALACDRTRVFSVQFTGSVDLTVYPIAGFNKDHHQMTHDEPGNQPLVHQSVILSMEQLATFITALKNVSEGAGTLLDNCAMMCTTDVSDGRTHSVRDMPVVLAGGAGGRLRRGLHHRSPGENTNKLLFSLLNAVGCGLTEFGEKGIETKQGLTAIEV
jgi:hypothetical protein